MADDMNNNSLPEYHLRNPIYKVDKAYSSVLKIFVESKNESRVGSAFLGETSDHQKMLFTSRHLFDVLTQESQQLNLICENPAKIQVFNIHLDEFNPEQVLLTKDPDSAVIQLSNNIIKQCQIAGSAFVNVGKFVPLKKQITILGFPEGGDFSFSTGYITEFNEQNFSHTAGSLPGNSGSMILSVDGNVAGIHIGAVDEYDVGVAININYVIKQILHRYHSNYSYSVNSSSSNFSDVVKYWRRPPFGLNKGL